MEDVMTNLGFWGGVGGALQLSQVGGWCSSGEWSSKEFQVKWRLGIEEKSPGGRVVENRAQETYPVRRCGGLAEGDTPFPAVGAGAEARELRKGAEIAADGKGGALR